jgi:uncharacterized protein (TIGR03067 family)
MITLRQISLCFAALALCGFQSPPNPFVGTWQVVEFDDPRGTPNATYEFSPTTLTITTIESGMVKVDTAVVSGTYAFNSAATPQTMDFEVPVQPGARINRKVLAIYEFIGPNMLMLKLTTEASATRPSRFGFEKQYDSLMLRRR